MVFGLSCFRAEWSPAQATGAIDDVALRPGGVLAGRLLAADPLRPPADVGSLRVLLLRQGRLVAETTAGPDGRFEVGSLPGGCYQVVVRTAEGPRERLCRLWAPATAPPCAATELAIGVGAPVVRGQARLALTLGSRRTRRTVLFGALIAGAIATPIVYGSTAKELAVPASP